MLILRVHKSVLFQVVAEKNEKQKNVHWGFGSTVGPRLHWRWVCLSRTPSVKWTDWQIPQLRSVAAEVMQPLSRQNSKVLFVRRQFYSNYLFPQDHLQPTSPHNNSTTNNGEGYVYHVPSAAKASKRYARPIPNVRSLPFIPNPSYCDSCH